MQGLCAFIWFYYNLSLLGGKIFRLFLLTNLLWKSSLLGLVKSSAFGKSRFLSLLAPRYVDELSAA